MTGTKRDYDYFHAVSYLGLLTFLSVDKGQRQDHVLNRYLPKAWGLRKDDVTLGSIMRGNKGITIDRFSYWMNNQLSPYVKHGRNILERLDYDNGIHHLSHSTKYILEDVYKEMPEDSSGERYYTVLEVNAAIALATVAFFDAQRKDSFIFLILKMSSRAGTNVFRKQGLLR